MRTWQGITSGTDVCRDEVPELCGSKWVIIDQISQLCRHSAPPSSNAISSLRPPPRAHCEIPKDRALLICHPLTHSHIHTTGRARLATGIVQTYKKPRPPNRGSHQPPPSDYSASAPAPAPAPSSHLQHHVHTTPFNGRPRPHPVNQGRRTHKGPHTLPSPRQGPDPRTCDRTQSHRQALRHLPDRRERACYRNRLCRRDRGPRRWCHGP